MNLKKYEKELKIKKIGIRSKTGKMADCERERNLKIMMSMIKRKHDLDIKK